MKIGKFIFRMRHKQSIIAKAGKTASFGNFVGGSVELNEALKAPPIRNLCFIIPGGGASRETKHDNYIDQVLVEQFAVIVCLKADLQSSDKYGFLAYDKIHDVRNEVMAAFLGWQIAEAESVIRYKDESLIDFNNAYLWYQFNFEYNSRLFSRAIFEDNDVVEGGVVDQGYQDVDVENPLYLDKIYTQYYINPDLAPTDPTQELPVPDGFPDVKLPDIAQWIETK